MLALAGASLSALGGGLLIAAATFLIWLYSGSKAHAPAVSPPQSEDEAEDEGSDSGAVADIPWCVVSCLYIGLMGTQDRHDKS